jgi:ATP synthase protein I
MAEKRRKDAVNDETIFSQQIGQQASRKLKAQQGSSQSIWFGLGMSGLVGWSVTVPALMGVALGMWIDQRYPSSYSWTLMLMLIGMIVGCLNAWHWVDSQHKEMHEKSDD